MLKLKIAYNSKYAQKFKVIVVMEHKENKGKCSEILYTLEIWKSDAKIL